MKTIHKFLISAILFTNFIYCQVSTSITDVLVNNQTTVTNCNTIDFGSISNNNLSFFYKLQKNSAGYCSDGNLKIILKYSSSTFGSQRGVMILLSSLRWDSNNRAEGYISCNISESEVQVSGSSIHLEYSDCNNNKTQSCEYPIIKTIPPSFSLSPTTVSLVCGDTSSRTFNVTPLNIPSGAIVTYQWSYSGWSQLSYTTNSITLTPASAALLPSNVSVTPFINGVAQPNMSCSVSRADFTSTASINGNTVICPGGNSVYTINDLGAGNTVTWGSSNTAIATVSGGTQSQVTVNGLSQGLVNLIATVTNSCGQIAPPLIKSLNIGAPVMANGVIYGELWVRKNFFPLNLNFPAVLGATTYTWSLAQSSEFPPSCPIRGAISAKFSNNSQAITTTTPSATATFGNCLGDYFVNCSVSNVCGSTDAYMRYVTVGDSGSSPCASGFALSKKYELTQNPIKNGEIKINKLSNLVIDNFPLESDPLNPSIVNGDDPCYQEWPKTYTGKRNLNVNKAIINSLIEVKLFDFNGKQVYTKSFEAIDEEIAIDDSNLKPGKYIMHINDGIGTQKKIIIIE
jgi:hypothetical protein